MKSQLITLFFISFLFVACHGQNSVDIKIIPPTVFAEKIKTTPDAQILDVRTPEEYAGQHIDNAQNVNWNSDDFVANAEKFDKSKPVFVYCMVGGRSHKAAEKLATLGFTEIYDLQGGIIKWNAEGLSKPSEKIVGMCSQEYNGLLNSDKKVLISFYAEWCAPCKKMTPYMLEMQKKLANEVVIIRLNADEHKTLVSEMKIDELPTLILYKDKKTTWKHSGYISEEDLKKQLQ